MENITEKKLNRICPICASSSGDVLYVQNFIVPGGFPLNNSGDGKMMQRIVSCCGCGFVFIDANLSQKDYDKYYDKYAKYSSVLPLEPNLKITDINNYLINFVESVCNSGKNGRIIDVGCGSGSLLIDLKSRGFTDLYGLDISRVTADLLGRYGIKYKTGGITEKNIDLGESELFDVVCLISVLEHVYDIDIALPNILKMLRNDATLIILVPDAAYYHKELTNPINQINLEHINHFDAVSLDNLMKKYGFVPHVSDKYVMRTQKSSSTQIVRAYKKGSAPESKNEFSFAGEASNSVRLLAEKWKKMQVSEEIRRIASSREEVVVYGTGNYTYNMLADTVLKDCNIIAFVDSNPNKQGASLFGLPVFGPDFLPGFPGTIIVSVTYDPQVIIQQLSDRGLKNKMCAI